ncbi:hypothetical protein BGLA2_780008 [Burkholderia gladioli]|nr:hypothetical protein BGLA2_780008 [Burkholderia gladioli]
MLARQLTDTPSYPGGTGERDESDCRRADQRLTDVCSTIDDLQHTLWQPSLGENLRQDDAAGYRRLWIGLQDNRIPQGQRWGHRAHRQQKRKVPG